MKKRMAFIAIIMAVLFTLTACSRSQSSPTIGSTNENAFPPSAPMAPPPNTSSNKVLDSASPPADAMTPPNTNQSGFVPDADQKLIYTGNISVETKEFDKADAAIQGLIAEMGGFIESSNYFDNSSPQGYYGQERVVGARGVSYCIRVPQDKFEDFCNRTGEVGLILSKGTQVENITAQYADTSTHYESLKVQHDRLIELMKTADKLEDLLTIESRLSELRWQMDSLTNQLKNWDTSVSFSTVNLDLREVKEFSEVESQGFFALMAATVKNSMSGYVDFLVELLQGLLYCLPYIITVLIALFAIILPVKKAMKKRRERANSAAAEQKTDDNKLD